MTKTTDQNDRAKAGTLPSDPDEGTRPVVPDQSARIAVAKRSEGTNDPNDVQAEASLIGTLLWCGAYAPEALSITSVVDLVPSADVFFDPSHASIYEAMLVVSESGKPIDAITIHSELVRRRADRAVGGIDTLEQLVSLAESSSVIRARAYAEAVRDAWLRRRIIAASEAVARDCRSGKVTAGEAVVRSVEAMRPIGEAVSTDAGVTSLEASVRNVFRTLAAGTKADFLPTGFRDLDAIIAGFFARETTILAARTSVGKTAMATQICFNIVAQHKSVAILYVTLEMPADSFTKRLIASRALVDGHKLRRGEGLTPYDVQKITAAAKEMAPYRIYFAQSQSQTILSIHAMAKAKAAALASEGIRLCLIVIDHIGLVKSSVKMEGKDRHLQVGEVSRGLRFLTEQHGCHVLALCQISRKGEGKKMPLLSDLKDSGSIEEDADNVIILHREKDDTDMFIPGRPAWVNVAKGRNDGTGRFQLDVEPRFLRFSDVVGV